MINVNGKLKGVFSPITVIRGDGSVETYQAPNLVLDSGIAIATAGGNGITSNLLLTNCVVGTGATPPAVTDTALVSQLAVSPNGVMQSGTYSYDEIGDDLSAVTVMRYTFAIGAVVGNISEIGIRPSGQTNLFSRALIVDGGGSPTTITVTASDQLIVDYTLTGTISRTVTFTGLTMKHVGAGSADRAMIFNFCVSSMRYSANTAAVLDSGVFDFPVWNATATLTGGTNLTPVSVSTTNPAAGFKRRIQIPSQSGNLGSGFNWFKYIDSSVSSQNTFDPAWFIKFDSNILKTNLDVYELEVITTFSNVV